MGAARDAGILGKILVVKRQEVAWLKASRSAGELRALAREASSPRDFMGALCAARGNAIIAEVKRASPSAGGLAREISAGEQVRLYQAGGAAALSVLTDREFFKGSLADLAVARSQVSLPVLRKDFIIDPLQVYEARAAGADAILLIAAALEPQLLSELFALAGSLGLAALIEVHQAPELEAVLALNPSLVGINNRDLRTLEVSLETSLELRALIPGNVLVVGESGITCKDDISRLKAGGVEAFLVGTALMQAQDPQAALRHLVEAP